MPNASEGSAWEQVTVTYTPQGPLPLLSERGWHDLYRRCAWAYERILADCARELERRGTTRLMHPCEARFDYPPVRMILQARCPPWHVARVRADFQAVLEETWLRWAPMSFLEGNDSDAERN